jgi:hypothetical protein
MNEKLCVMEAIKKRLKATAWCLTILLLFQSCVVYHKTPTTLEKASREQTKTKITNTNGELFKYGYITYEDGIYYGINKKSGELVKTTLDQEYINKVVTKNKSASTWVTVGVIGVPVLFLVVGGIIVSNNVGLEGGAWGYN